MHQMHTCTCCNTCQQEIRVLRQQNEALILDLPPLRQKALIARQTLQLYKEENVRLHQTKMELQARIQQFQQEKQVSTDGMGRQGRRVDELVRVINCKNGEIMNLKQEIGWKNYQIQNMRRRIEQIEAENATYIARMRTLQETPRFERQNKTLEDTSQSYRQDTSITKNHLSSFPSPPNITIFPPSPPRDPGQHRLNLINSKIEQLQHQNQRLRQHLITKI